MSWEGPCAAERERSQGEQSLSRALGLVLVQQRNCPDSHQPRSGWAQETLLRDAPCFEPLPSVPSMSPQSSFFHPGGLLPAPKGNPYLCLIQCLMEQQEEVLLPILCHGRGGGCEVTLSLTPAEAGWMQWHVPPQFWLLASTA